MSDSLMVTEMAGKVVKSLEKRLSSYGDGSVSGLFLVFTDGTTLEVSSVAFPDQSSELVVDFDTE